jgi:hypothetical protein
MKLFLEFKKKLFLIREFKKKKRKPDLHLIGGAEDLQGTGRQGEEERRRTREAGKKEEGWRCERGEGREGRWNRRRDWADNESRSQRGKILSRKF